MKEKICAVESQTTELCITKLDGWQDEFAYLFVREKQIHLLFKQVGKLISYGDPAAVQVTNFKRADVTMNVACCLRQSCKLLYLNKCMNTSKLRQRSLLIASVP